MDVAWGDLSKNTDSQLRCTLWDSLRPHKPYFAELAVKRFVGSSPITSTTNPQLIADI